MYGKIKDYEYFLKTAGWERLGQNIWHDDGIYMFSVYQNYEDFKKINRIKKQDEYLYCIELDGNCVKVGFSAELNNRLKTHLEKQSAFFNHSHRIAILGPLEHGYNAEQMIHFRFSSFLSKTHSSVETYFFNEEVYSFDIFLQLFQIFQATLLTGEDNVFNKTELIKPHL